MVLGEKMWEEKGKIIGMSIKSIDSEGVHLEETFTTEVKGIGRVPSGRNMGTMNVIQKPSGVSSGTGQGYFTTPEGDSVMWKISFFGKVEAGKSKSIYIVQFVTSSQKLAWMNTLMAVGEGIADSATMEIGSTGYEWK